MTKLAPEWVRASDGRTSRLWDSLLVCIKCVGVREVVGSRPKSVSPIAGLRRPPQCKARAGYVYVSKLAW